MDFARELHSTQMVQVGGYTVEEKIYRNDSFPDATYERFYTVDTGRAGKPSITLGSYEDESEAGMKHPPKVAGGWLVVLSSAHAFFWRPGEEPRHFTPFEVTGWYEYAKEHQINGHYDYAATRVRIDGERWVLEYQCDRCPARGSGLLRFASTDGGETFIIDN